MELLAVVFAATAALAYGVRCVGYLHGYVDATEERRGGDASREPWLLSLLRRAVTP